MGWGAEININKNKLNMKVFWFMPKDKLARMVEFWSKTTGLSSVISGCAGSNPASRILFVCMYVCVCLIGLYSSDGRACAL